MEDGVWRTIGGHRVFIKSGQSLSDAMKESGKFPSKNKKTKSEERIKEIEELLETKVETEDINETASYSFEKDGKIRYLSKTKNNNFVITKDKNEFELKDKYKGRIETIIDEQKRNGWEVKEQIEKNSVMKPKIIGEEREKLKEELTALKSGYKDVEEYREVKRIKQEKENLIKAELKREKEIRKEKWFDSKKEKMENSYIYSQKRKSDATYNDWYEYGDRESAFYNTKMFEEVIKRKAGQIMNIEEVHHSAKSGSKFSTSIYLKNKDTGIEVRISDHYLPDTPEREYKRSLTGGETRWDKELVLTQSEMEDIVNIKTKKEFDKYLKDLFS